jgi:hypothetical protein
MIKKMKFRGMKQKLEFLKEFDTITEDCFYIYINGTFSYWYKEGLSYDEIVNKVVNDDQFNLNRATGTWSAGDKVSEHPKRIYFKIV